MSPPTFTKLLLILIITLQTKSTTTATTRAPAVELWCVAKNNAEDAALLSAINWACGPQGGTDCSLIQNGGPCYDPNDVQRTASYAFNSYFLKHGLTEDSCDFASTAALTSLSPSHGSCKFPSSLSVNNGSYTGSPANTGFGSSTADISSATHITTTLFWSSVYMVHLLFTILIRF